MGHISFECLEKENVGQKITYVAQAEQEKEKPMAENIPDTRESSMMNKILLKPKKEVVEPV